MDNRRSHENKMAAKEIDLNIRKMVYDANLEFIRIIGKQVEPMDNDIVPLFTNIVEQALKSKLLEKYPSLQQGPPTELKQIIDKHIKIMVGIATNNYQNMLKESNMCIVHKVESLNDNGMSQPTTSDVPTYSFDHFTSKNSITFSSEPDTQNIPCYVTRIRPEKPLTFIVIEPREYIYF